MDDMYVKLCDTSNFINSSVPINEAKILSHLKLLFSKITEGKGIKKQLDFHTSYFFFMVSSVYFVFVAESKYDVNEEMFP